MLGQLLGFLKGQVCSDDSCVGSGALPAHACFPGLPASLVSLSCPLLQRWQARDTFGWMSDMQSCAGMLTVKLNAGWAD